MGKPKKNENERHGIGGNNPPKALATAAQCSEALTNEASLTKNKNDATATRFRLFLMLTCSDAQFASDMSAAWANSIAPAGQTAETRERVRNAKDRLFTMFRVSTLPDKEAKDKESKEQTDRRMLIQRNCLDTVHLCSEVFDKHYETDFTFNDKGGAFIKRESPLGQRIWSEKEWDKVPDLVASDVATVQLTATTWYAEKGRSIAWSDLRTMLIGGKREPGEKAGKAARQIVSDANVSEAMQRVRAFYETNAPTANELPAIRSSVENALRVVRLSIAPVMNAVKLVEQVNALEEAIFAVIGRGSPDVKVTGGTGKVTNIAEHNAKAS